MFKTVTSKLIRWQRMLNVEALVDIPIIHGFEADYQTVGEHFRNLLANGDWDQICLQLGQLEMERSATPNGARHYDIALDALMSPFDDALDIAEETGIDLSADMLGARLDAFVECALSRPKDHIATTLAAMAHMRVGWAYRGDDWIDNIHPHDLIEMEKHYRKAETLLARFNAYECNSPLIARAKYFSCLGLPHGENFIRNAYETWVDLDPENSMAMETHGFHLLPRWFGTMDEVEKTAQLAAETTYSLSRGASGYALFCQPVFECEPNFRKSVNTELLIVAYMDLAKTAAAQPDVNYALYGLLEILEHCTDQRHITAAKAALRLIAEKHLKELWPVILRRDPVQTKRDLFRLFESEMAGGGHIRFDKAGMTITATPAE